MLVLQSSTDFLHTLPGLSSETLPTSADGACNFSNTGAEKDIGVNEQGSMDIKEEADIGIKQEEFPEDITFPDIKSEPDEVSCVCMSVIRHILPVFSIVSCFCDISISGQLKQLHCLE
jgi:hypothetical protein